ncbi:MAG TPA: methyltransferase domain-containing protein [Candidatus Hydrogenedens sp.]|nr:methyltransferase domain-containing protein [Candidatus Hydrogenedens sp.]
MGNVLSHYFHIEHDVVDKYEKAEGVINEDVVNFRSSKKYDLIVSIYTLEHVGWDENPREPEKIFKAIENLETLLSPGGKIVITLPIGWNQELDRFLREGKLKFDKQYCFKRISKDNEWVETNLKDICELKYGKPFYNANGLVIGIIEKK